MRAQPTTPTVTHTVLVVDGDRQTRSQTSAALADAGYQVTQASTFADARQRLVLAKPDVLITAVRLGGFNGMHLVVSSRATLPEMVAIVTHAVPDPALQADAARNHAVFLVQPVDRTLVLSVVDGLLSGRETRHNNPRPRRWTRKTPADHLGATLGVTPATIVNLSYGGVRLRLDTRVADGSRQLQTLALPAAGIAVRARPVWTQGAGPGGPWWCGVEVEEADAAADRRWRRFVDAVTTVS